MSDVAAARLYLVAGEHLAAGRLAELVPELAAAGVDIVQLRAKGKEAAHVLAAGEPVAAACRAAHVPFIVNDRPDVALALGADGVHLGQDDLPADVARRILGRRLIGRSTHSREQIDAEVGLDTPPAYIAVGPVHPTPTKPGRRGVGLDLVRYAAGRVHLPWFAIGGLDAATLPAAIEAGARRVVVVRAITEARDPVVAAAHLRSLLHSAPLARGDGLW
ncbi:thiamine phosphate synthase [soil metagenome]